MALGLYTALPGFARWDEDVRGWLAAMLPAVGLLLGLCWWGIAAIARQFLPPMLGAAAVALVMPVLTGFLHLDGFMDVSDALLSSRPREEKLRILKDPHAGAFAVIALGCLLVVQVAAADGALRSGVRLQAFVLLAIVTRAMAGWSVMALTPLAQSGFARMNHETATYGRRAACGVWLAAAVIVAFAGLGWRVGVSMLVAVAGFVLPCAVAVRSLGGMNGDVSGWSIVWAEACGLVALACLGA